MQARHQLLPSVLLMVGATALWAFAFIVPLAVPDATASDIMIGRYLAYGACSSILLLKAGMVRLSWRDWMLALAFAVFGNLLYYLVLVLGIQLAGAGLAVPIIGLLPVTVSIFGNVRDCDLPARALAAPLAAVFAGLLLINLSQGQTPSAAVTPSILGIACLVLPVIMWTWYAVANAAFLKRRSDISGTEWASVVGVATFALTLLLLLCGWAFGSVEPSIMRLRAADQWTAFLVWSVVLGVGASWGAAALFNVASACLPVALTGQLIVFETVFGAAYVFLAQGRPPSAFELAGFTLAILGIWLSIRAYHARSSLNSAGEGKAMRS